jgi:hypothetical protein
VLFPLFRVDKNADGRITAEEVKEVSQSKSYVILFVHLLDFKKALICLLPFSDYYP